MVILGEVSAPGVCSSLSCSNLENIMANVLRGSIQPPVPELILTCNSYKIGLPVLWKFRNISMDLLPFKSV